MIHVEIDTDIQPAIRRQEVKHAAQIVLDLNDRSKSDMSIVLTGDERLQTLNRDYRDVDAPTDVLSFAAGDADPESGLLYLGDVILSVERASAQAKQFGHTVNEEISLLVIHGTLHLLGFDHAEPEDKKRMWLAQGSALEKAGLPAGILHE